MNPLWIAIPALAGVVLVRYLRGRPPGWPMIGTREPIQLNLGKYWDDRVIRLVDAAVAACTGGAMGRRIDRLAPDRRVDALQTCIAREVFPDVPWPPVEGDHGSIPLAWHKLGMVAESVVEEGDEDDGTVVGEAWTGWEEEEEPEYELDAEEVPEGTPAERGISVGGEGDDCSC